MAKLTAPLMSFGASGKLAKTLVYGTWKGIPTVRQYVVPANPKSPGQTVQRGLLAHLTAVWRGSLLTAAARTGWNLLASVRGLAMSGYNLFVSQLTRLSAEVPAASIVSGIASTTFFELSLAMANIDTMGTGTETGDFLISFGADRESLGYTVTKTIAAGNLTLDASDAGYEVGDVIYIQVRKAGTGTQIYDRSGLIEVELGE